MSDPEKSVQDFLQRWSRRKLGDPDRIVEDSDAETDAEASAPHQQADPAKEAAKEATGVFDPKTLPPIESIDATTDIRGFLAPGVPPELTRAALRRAYASNPTIRDFVGLAENQWDFTKPDGVPGFGPLELTPALRRMVDRLFGDADDAGAGEGLAHHNDAVDPENVGKIASGEQSTAATTALDVSPVVVPYGEAAAVAPIIPPDTKNVAAQEDGEPEQVPASPKHGGALPK